MTLDLIDKAIIALLLQDGKRTYRSIAEELSMSHSTVQYHLKKLQDSGFLVRSTVSLDLSLITGIHCFIDISVKESNRSEIFEILQREPCVIQIFTVSGKADYTVEFFSPQKNDVKRFCTRIADLCEFSIFPILRVTKKGKIPL